MTTTPMTHRSEHKHADLSHALHSITVLAELTDEWCADLQAPQADAPATTSAPQATAAQPVPDQAAQAAQATLL